MKTEKRKKKTEMRVEKGEGEAGAEETGKQG
jgi:hypothetical protein